MSQLVLIAALSTADKHDVVWCYFNRIVFYAHYYRQRYKRLLLTTLCKVLYILLHLFYFRSRNN